MKEGPKILKTPNNWDIQGALSNTAIFAKFARNDFHTRGLAHAHSQQTISVANEH